MKNILYILAIIGLLTACKQETPFPPGLSENERIKSITSFIIDTLNINDTLLKMKSIGNYDPKGRIQDIQFFLNSELIRTLSFDFVNSQQISVNVSPKDFYGQAISGSLFFDSDGRLKKILDRGKPDFGGIINDERVFNYNGSNLSTTYVLGTDPPLPFQESGYNVFNYSGNNLVYYKNAYYAIDSIATRPWFYLKINNQFQVFSREISLEFASVNTTSNYFMINSDEYYDFENNNGAFIPGDFSTLYQYNYVALAGNFSIFPFLSNVSFLGKNPENLIHSKTINGFSRGNPSALYYKWQYSYEMDNQNRVIKKEQKTMSGQLLRVWYYEYEG